MAWTVSFSNAFRKNYAKLPKIVKDRLNLLVLQIKMQGPVRGNWPYYGKLSDGRHHCHLKDGHTCYVAIWEEIDDQINLIEVTYVGTHEKAPY